MGSVILLIEGLSALNPMLPIIAKISLIALVILIAWIPVSFIAWVISAAFSKALEALTDSIALISSKLFFLSRKCSARSSRLMKVLYAKYSTVVSFDSPKFELNEHPLRQSVDDFYQEFKLVPAISFDREAKKSALILQLNTSLGELSGNIGQLNDVSIPQLELNKDHEVLKKKALNQLRMFIPLLICVVMVNSALLYTVFDDLFAGREVFDVSYAAVVALMFTMIELGVGAIFGFMDYESKQNLGAAPSRITHIFGWSIVFFLAMVELLLYFMVGTGESGFDFLASGEIMEMFVNGGFISLLGPSIVFALYIFGHSSSMAFFNYSRETDFARFERDLNDKNTMFNIIQDGVDKISEAIKGIVAQIRKENIDLNKISAEEISVSLNQFGENLDRRVNSINEALKNAEIAETPVPEIETQVLNLEDTTSFHRINLVYFLMFAASILVMTIALPAEFSLGDLSVSGTLEHVAAAILIVALATFAGLSLMSNVLISQTTDGLLAKAILEGATILNMITAAIITALCLLVIYLIFSPISLTKNIIPFIFCLLSMAGSFVVGRKLFQAVGSWYAMSQAVWINIKSIVFSCLGFSFLLLGKLISLIDPMLRSVSFPSRFIFRKV